MKTYSVALQNKDGQWFTNWHKYAELADVDWNEVLAFCLERGYKAYGYYFGNKSNELTSSRCRTVLACLI